MVSKTETTKVKSTRKRIVKYLGIAVSAIMLIAIASFLFLHFMPGYGMYFVESGSMVPAFDPGDIVITGPPGSFGAAELAPGTVITYKEGNQVVTHRIISVDGSTMKTKGDANRTVDPGTVAVSSVQGVYLFRIPYLGYINALVSNRKGWWLLVILPTIVLILFIVKDIIKESFKSENKSENG